MLLVMGRAGGHCQAGQQLRLLGNHRSLCGEQPAEQPGSSPPQHVQPSARSFKPKAHALPVGWGGLDVARHNADGTGRRTPLLEAWPGCPPGGGWAVGGDRCLSATQGLGSYDSQLQ